MHSDTNIKLDRRRNALFALLTSVFVGVYWKCLRNGLVYDDRRAIAENPVFESKDLLDLARNIWSCDFWGTPYTQETSHKSWRPLTTGVFVLQSTVAAFCGVPVEAVYHAVSVALHSVNGLLVYMVADNSGIRLSGLAAGIFWLHPVTIESVCPAVGQADLIPTAILLAVLVDLKCFLTSRASIYPHCIILLVSNFFKETSISSHYILALLLYKHRPVSQKNTLAIFTTLLLATLYLFSKDKLQNVSSLDNPIRYLSSSEKYTAILSSWLHSIKLLCWPTVLCSDWSLFKHIFNPNASVICGITTIFLSATARKNLKTWSNYWHLVVWGGIAYFPVSHLPMLLFDANVGYTVAERSLYAPLVPFSMLAAEAVAYVASFISPNSSKAMKICILSLLASRSFSRIDDWYSDSTLFKADRSCSGAKMVVNSISDEIAGSDFDSGRLSIHVKELELVVKQPFGDVSQVNYCLGVVYSRQHNITESTRYFKRAVQQRPNFMLAWLHLANTTGNHSYYQKALQIKFHQTSESLTEYQHTKLLTMQNLVKNQRLPCNVDSDPWLHFNCLYLNYHSKWLSPPVAEICNFAEKNHWSFSVDHSVVAAGKCRDVGLSVIRNQTASRQCFTASAKLYENGFRSTVADDSETMSGLYTNLGGVYQLLQKYDTAKAHYRKALSLDSQNIVAFSNLRKLP